MTPCNIELQRFKGVMAESKSKYLEVAQVEQNEGGKFVSKYKEKRGQPIALRLPESLDRELREVVGWSSGADNPKLKAWVEEAIAERLRRQKKK